jgi:hypothetical protein
MTYRLSVDARANVERRSTHTVLTTDGYRELLYRGDVSSFNYNRHLKIGPRTRELTE